LISSSLISFFLPKFPKFPKILFLALPDRVSVKLKPRPEPELDAPLATTFAQILSSSSASPDSDVADVLDVRRVSVVVVDVRLIEGDVDVLPLSLRRVLLLWADTMKDMAVMSDMERAPLTGLDPAAGCSVLVGNVFW